MGEAARSSALTASRKRNAARRALSASATVTVSAALGLFPLYTQFSYSNITQAKWQGALGLGLLSAFCALFALFLTLAFRQGRRLRWHRVCLPVGLYFFCVALSALLGPLADTVNARGEAVWWMGALRYEGLATQLVYGILFLSASLHPPRVRAVLAAEAAALVAFCAVVALQYAGQNPLGLYPEGRSIYTNYEFQGTIGNIDMVSGYLSLALPMLLAGFLLVRGKLRGFLLAAAGLGMLLEMCIEVQSGLLMLAAALLWVLGYGLCRPESRRACLWVLALAAFCAAVRTSLVLPWLDGAAQISLAFNMRALALLFLALVFGGSAEALRQHPLPALRPRLVLSLALALVLATWAVLGLVDLPAELGGLYELSEILHGRAKDSFGSYRLGVWRNTLQMALKNLWTGTGPDTFYYAFRAQLTEAGLSYPETFDNAHNEYLTIFSNNGLPALAAYLAFLFSMLFLGARRAKKRPAFWITTLPIACYALQAFFSFSICIVTPMFWVVLGLHAAALAKARVG